MKQRRSGAGRFNQATAAGGFGRAAVLFAPALMLMVSAMPASAENGEEADARRPERLADALNGHDEWQIGIVETRTPEPRAFRDAVADGTALESSAYVEIHRQLQSQLSSAVPPSAEREGMSALRERIRERVELNLDAGYFYAAGVYIEMLDISGADPAEVRRLTETLRERRG